GAEEPNGKGGGLRGCGEPVHDSRYPSGEQVDVKAQVRGVQVDALLFFGEEVGKDGAEAAVVENAGHVTITGAVAPAAAAVGDGDDAARPRGEGERRLQHDVADGDDHIAVHDDDPTPGHLR